MSKEQKSHPGAELISITLRDLRSTVAHVRAIYGRDFIRSLSWGTTLDAMDSGRTQLHPHDVLALISDYWGREELEAEKAEGTENPNVCEESSLVAWGTHLVEEKEQQDQES